jgi:fucose 4-O-acetylase-like acetyltransferase
MGRRLAWIEAARTLCSFLVVLAHVDIYTRAGVETWWPGGFYSVPVLSLAVPSFFVIAGYAVDMGTGHTSRSAILARVRRLVIPFFAWNVITLVVLAEPGKSAGRIVFEILTGAWHLYFIFALLQLLVLHALLVPAIDAGKLRRIVVTAVALTVMSYAASEAILWLNGADNGTAEVLHRKIFTFWAGFFAIGVWWRRRGSRNLSTVGWILTALVIGAAFAIYIFDLELEVSSFGFTPRKQLLFGGLAFQLLASATMLVLIEKLDGTRFITALAPWGRDSYGIYLVHISVMLLLFRFLLSSGWLTISWYQVPVLTVSTYLISLAFVRAVRAARIPALKLMLLGESNR